jgi:hypothetical protein
MTDILDHRDKLNQIIKVNDFILYSTNDEIALGQVLVARDDRKMIRISAIPKPKRAGRSIYRYSSQVVRIDEQLATIAILSKE